MNERAAFRALLGLLIVGLVALYAIAARRDNGGPAAAPDPYQHLVWLAQSKPAPDQSFVGPDGAPLSLGAFKGRVVLVNLWASWCEPCTEEMPALARLEKDLGGPGFTVVTVSLDRKPEEGKAWLAKNGIRNLAFNTDPKWAFFGALQAPGLPLSVFIDKDGNEVGRIAGAVPWDEPRARALIAKAGGRGAP